MTTKATRRLVNVAIGIGAAGVFGINIATRVIQRKHRKQDYCAIPLRLAQENKKCVQLLGGGDMKIKNLNLKTVVLTETEFKSAIPVWGNTRGANIYTKSLRNSADERWQLQYAVFVVQSKQQSWRVWLHPVDGNYEGDDLPSEVTNFQQHAC